MSQAEEKSDGRLGVDLFAARSLLFLPASNPRAIAKARASDADLAILDLEDAVRPDDKDAARDAAVQAVAEDWPMPVAIRVNGVGTRWHDADVVAVAAAKVGTVVVPRVESSDGVAAVSDNVGKPVMAMIETAAGVIAAPQIAPLTGGLIAGTNDLRADLRLPLDADRAPIQSALQWIVLAARAAGVPVFDGVFNGLKDDAGLAAECEEGRMLGFDGKSLIHPDQIAACHRCSAPTADELERAQALIDAYDGGAQRFHDEMIERMHIDAARGVIARSSRSGLANRV